MKKSCFGLTAAMLALALTFATVPNASADVPPPPVNQTLGIFDATIDFTQPNINREFCQVCHEGSQVERHHALVTPEFGCFECHVVHDGSFANFRECTTCHETSPHHTTADAQARHCSACHGSFVADYDDGHYIPRYNPTAFTPLTGGVELAEGRFAGGCMACHMADVDQGIANNNETHHGTGLIECTWCHNFELSDNRMIRKCEDCHDVKSLHNIQADSNNDGMITPGTEMGGYGHVGANADCYGCHIKTFLAFQSATVAEPTIPSITSLSTSVLAAGQSTNLTIMGESFVNTSLGQTFTPVVEVTNGDEVILLYPLPSFTSQKLTTPLPATLEPGNYDLRVKKDEVVSNKVTLTVTAAVEIQSAIINRNQIVITGFDFGNRTGETLRDNSLGTVMSWSDKKVVTRIPDAMAGQTVTLVTASGSVASAKIAASKYIKKNTLKEKFEKKVKDRINSILNK